MNDLLPKSKKSLLLWEDSLPKRKNSLPLRKYSLPSQKVSLHQKKDWLHQRLDSLPQRQYSLSHEMIWCVRECVWFVCMWTIEKPFSSELRKDNHYQKYSHYHFYSIMPKTKGRHLSIHVHYQKHFNRQKRTFFMADQGEHSSSLWKDSLLLRQYPLPPGQDPLPQQKYLYLRDEIR